MTGQAAIARELASAACRLPKVTRRNLRVHWGTAVPTLTPRARPNWLE